jgi:CheY-like chemotaxis protein
MKILWVEDQPGDAREYWAILKRHGDTVWQATNVDQALNYLDAEVYDIIILDIAIPLGISPAVGHLEDTDYNVQYVVDRIRQDGLFEISRIVCLSNFSPMVPVIFKDLPVQVIAKNSFLREFEAVIYGE